ncbi:hypothetical protein Hamer_G004410 [Homarus americanus]|uniref:Uncharacterized protein n=1 Tax=Homarus americanus TaxID=6706 RepID=A0A8J5JS84_HOMAM|nr:hypothetical protein Hamer_G004410 [Homarus americanus]
MGRSITTCFLHNTTSEASLQPRVSSTIPSARQADNHPGDDYFLPPHSPYLVCKYGALLSHYMACFRQICRDKELINDMIVPLLHQWTKANALFKPPVINQCRTIELKLTKLWHKAVETSLGKGNLARKNEFLHTLDTLFDILTCKCSIQLCSESKCSIQLCSESNSGKRENNSHIDCGCPREKKIPVLELEFIKAQRTKAEGQGSMQMGSIDYSETKKQIANAKKREQIREREQKKKMKSEEAIQREEELCQDVYHFFDIPPINVNATKLSELVDLSLEVLEPPLTTSLTSQELRNLKETPMQVPKWPSHTQSVERCVKMVTEAAGHVYSHERREDLFQQTKSHDYPKDFPYPRLEMKDYESTPWSNIHAGRQRVTGGRGVNFTGGERVSRALRLSKHSPAEYYLLERGFYQTEKPVGGSLVEGQEGIRARESRTRQGEVGKPQCRHRQIRRERCTCWLGGAAHRRSVETEELPN